MSAHFYAENIVKHLMSSATFVENNFIFMRNLCSLFFSQMLDRKTDSSWEGGGLLLFSKPYEWQNIHTPLLQEKGKSAKF